MRVQPRRFNGGGLTRQVRCGCSRAVQRFRFGGYEVQTVSPHPHDAYDPVGVYFRQWSGTICSDPFRSVAWLTDPWLCASGIGPHILRMCMVLVLEANHDEGLLDMDEKRPPSA